MKTKYITHIILEGTDGVGKDTIMANIWRKYNFKYRVYMRGELSDYVYAIKYHREFISTQSSLPFLYVLITKDKELIKQQIIKRNLDVDEELDKLNDQDLFLECAEKMKNDYHIIIVDTSNLSIEDACNKVYNETMKYINHLNESVEPDENNKFNEMYIKGAEKINCKWTVRNGQTFLNNEMIKADAQLHNGRFETYDNLTIPHNLIFSLGYKMTKPISIKDFNKKEYDFSYPINSKILVRKEIYDYIKIITKTNTIYTTNSQYIPFDKNIYRFDKVFGDDYINEISKAKATFYCSRDLAYLEMMTVRCYEAVLANQIIFVDKQTDPYCKILNAIFNDEKDKLFIDLLYCDENSLIDNYNIIIHNEHYIEYILSKQRIWYNNLRDTLLREGLNL